MVVRGVTFTWVYYDELSEYTCNIHYVVGTVLVTLYTDSKGTVHLHTNVFVVCYINQLIALLYVPKIFIYTLTL